jgi:periplasmic protein TonB
MFETSLLASSTQRYPRGWTTLVSLAIQTFFVGTLILVPMLFTDALPFHVPREVVQIPSAPQSAQSEAAASIQPRHHAEVLSERIQVPRSVPTEIIHFNDLSSTRFSGNSVPPDPSGIVSAGTGGPQIFAFLHMGTSVTPTIQKTPPKQGLLIRYVKPVYPRLAQAAGVQGEVVLQAIIGKDGRIENLRAISGNPLLVKAALDAVQQWRYHPYLLNSEPVEVETQITVRFTVS